MKKTARTKNHENEHSERESYFTGFFTPATIWETPKLFWLEKIFLMEIMIYKNDPETGGCRGSDDELGNHFHITGDMAFSVIDTLCRNGLVQCYENSETGERILCASMDRAVQILNDDSVLIKRDMEYLSRISAQ